jgi:hypothetical protein
MQCFLKARADPFETYYKTFYLKIHLVKIERISEYKFEKVWGLFCKKNSTNVKASDDHHMGMAPYG